MPETVFDCRHLKNLLPPNRERIELAKQRQSDVWRGKKPDRWPIFMSGRLTEEQKQIPRPTRTEAFTDKAMMLCREIVPGFAAANAGSDSIPSLRANTGTGTLLSCFGLEQVVSGDQMPWLKNHLAIEQAAVLTPDDIRFGGKFSWALDFISFAREILDNQLNIYCLDTQGPFDLAHLLLGDQVFFLMMDDPALMHQVMDLCTTLYIRCTKAVKEAIGEPAASSLHGCQHYFPNAGVRICEDTTTIISRAMMEEFTLPYTLRAARAFGGAWVHYCGRCDDLRDLLCQCDEVRGLNYGIVPGKEKDIDFDREITLLAGHGKVYTGAVPRRDGETGADYLRRLHGYAQTGCFIPFGQAAVNGESGFTEVAAALDFWYGLD